MTKRLLILTLLCGPLVSASSAGDAASQPSDTLIGQQIDALLSQTYQSDEPGAAVIVSKGGEILFRGAYGLADMERGIRLRPEMVFAIGSAGKPFTAMAIMILDERRKLSLDDDITKFLPGYPTAENRITIRHLLTHTSGIMRLHSSKAYWTRIREDVTPNELIGMFKNEPMEFAPGDQYRYCNSGYHLLGKIVEQASGQPFEQFLRSHVFERLGMNNTFLVSGARSIASRVKGYHKDGNRFQIAPPMSYTHLYAAGDVCTNVDDLARWGRALSGECLVSRTWLKQSSSPFILNNGESTNVALGWFLTELGGRQCIYHGGGIFGYVAHTLYLPEERLYVALLSNRVDRMASPSTQDIAERVAAIALGEPRVLAKRRTITLPPEQLLKYAGTYRAVDAKGAEFVRRIEVDGEHVLYVDGGRKTELLCESETTFFVDGKVSIITFDINSESQVAGMVLHVGGEGGSKVKFTRE